MLYLFSTHNQFYKYRSYETVNLSTVLKEKYQNLFKLYEEITSYSPQERPDCEEILKRKEFYELSEKDLDISEEMKRQINSKANKNDVSVFYLLKSLRYSKDRSLKLNFFKIRIL
jgi:hypothetical protein